MGWIGLDQPAVIHGNNLTRRSTAQDSGPSLKTEATRVSSQWSWIASRSVWRFPASVHTLGVLAFREVDRTFRHMRWTDRRALWSTYRRTMTRSMLPRPPRKTLNDFNELMVRSATRIAKLVYLMFIRESVQAH
jgi:hypothetical protein